MNYLAVQYGLFQNIPPVAQGQQKEGRILPQQIQKDPVSFPRGKAVQKFPADPFQIPLVAEVHFPFKAVGGEEVHEFALALRVQEGDHATAAPGGQGQAGFLPDLSEQAFVRAFLWQEFAADADPFVVVDIVFLLDPVEHQHLISPGHIAQCGIFHLIDASSAGRPDAAE